MQTKYRVCNCPSHFCFNYNNIFLCEQAVKKILDTKTLHGLKHQKRISYILYAGMQKIKLLCSLIHENITTAGFLDLHQHQNLLTQVKSGIFFKWERLGADLTKYLRRGR